MGRDLNDVVDEIGFGPCQLLLLVLVGGIALIDGAEILVASSLLSALQYTWGLTALMKGMMMTVVFFGVFLGGLIGGNLGDVYGRRPAILLSYAGLVFFGGSIALSQGPISMLILRFFFGIAFGAGVSPGMTMIVECSPSTWRAHVLNLNSVAFFLGEIYCSLLLIVFMPNLWDPKGERWQWVQLLSVVPGIVLWGLAHFFLRESPHYHLSQGNQEEAISTVRHMALANDKAAVAESVSFDDPAKHLQLPPASEATSLAENESTVSTAASGPTSQSGATSATEPCSAYSWYHINAWISPKSRDKIRESVKVLGSTEYRGIVLGGAYLTFLGNFLFYGLTYALPQVFRALHHDLRPAVQVLIVSICDAPGVLLVFFFLYSQSLGHRDGLVILAACSSVLCLTLISIEHGHEGLYYGLPSAYLLKYTAGAFFSLAYVYLAEVFPASIRASGIAVCISAGRVGSMTAPLAAEALFNKGFVLFNHKMPHAPFFMVTSGLCALAVVSTRTFLHFELKNAPLINTAKKGLGAGATKSSPGKSDPEMPAAAG